ncbi:MAG: S-methyl-5-thioribose-1-phosphate isomerase [Thermoproteales archaeon]|nr:S-methyl-5-thioribose-1-phosphate isomerase [Thermoproteales archaeon]
MLGVPRTIEWVDGKVRLINQLSLPHKLEYIETRDYRRIAEAIKRMEIRGAPAIGVAAAYGLALAALEVKSNDIGEALKNIRRAAEVLSSTRPTAVNLFWAIRRVLKVAEKAGSVEELQKSVVEEALKIAREDEENNKKIGDFGEKLLEDGDTVITVCNAGSLATSYYGTATAPIYRALEKGKLVNVIVMETRPYLQGARLTAFELKSAGIPVKIITDNSIGIVAWKEKVDIAFVGADRFTKDGYLVNKIGTYPLALVCKEHSIPFYPAVPTSTIDLQHEINEVEIERRPGEEVVSIKGVRIAPEGVDALYYAFDITPPKYITGIITEKGIVYPPFHKNIKKILS